MNITGQLVDIHARRIFPARVTVADGRIHSITEESSAPSHFIMPGFVDAHVHVESSMLTPAEFARAAVVHGTVATVSDPHEIANVLGADGVEFMLDEASQVPLKIVFGAPSCVPATDFETAGAVLDSQAVTRMLADDRIGYLSEMMNYPGVLNADEGVIAKIEAAKAAGKQIDGHAPGLRGENAQRYVSAGITTDHECTTLEEALDKIAAGCRIQIREGSAAKNYEALRSLIDTHTDLSMLCTDDTHPDDLNDGHINRLVRRAIADGADRMNALRVASGNAVEHYGLDVGLLRPGDPADFIVVNDLDELSVLQTFINGQLVAENGAALFEFASKQCPNQFTVRPKQPVDFTLHATSDRALIIEAIDGELITNRLVETVSVDAGNARATVDNDTLKISVVNRYQDAAPAVALIRGFGLKSGAIASSVAHDSHNIVAVGTDDTSICAVVNEVIGNEGGLAVFDGSKVNSLALPVAGLMAQGTCQDVGTAYQQLSHLARQLGSQLTAPFMTLSFMALPVIPSLKLTDHGLFDVDRFEIVSPFV